MNAGDRSGSFMTVAVSRRVLGAIPLLLGVSILAFCFMHLMPGGPDALYARNGRLNQEQLDAVRENLGLDRPIAIQYVYWLGSVARGDLGDSYAEHRPVLDMILERLPNTLLLVATGMTLAAVLAILFGVTSAIYQYRPVDHLLNTFSFFGMAMPVFWIGLMLQMLFAVRLGWLPTSGMSSPDGGGVLDTARHLVLPSVVLAMGSLAFWSRYVRSSMLEVIRQDYMQAARARGLRDRVVYLRHGLRNALIPFVTVVGIDIPLYLVGAVVTETIFGWPGIGRLFYDSLSARDYPVLMGILMLSATLIVLGNLLADLVCDWLDPRSAGG